MTKKRIPSEAPRRCVEPGCVFGLVDDDTKCLAHRALGSVRCVPPEFLAGWEAALMSRFPTVEQAWRAWRPIFAVGDRVRIPVGGGEPDARGVVVDPIGAHDDHLDVVVIQLIGDANPRIFRRRDLIVDLEVPAAKREET